MLGGWQFSSITTAQTGAIHACTGNQCHEFSPGGACVAVLPAVISPRPAKYHALVRRVPAFVARGKAGTTPFVFGNSGRNILKGPNFVNFDFSTFKWFTITERMKIVFRSEFFNIFNHPNFNLPNANVDTPQAGIITATRAPRVIQFAMKLFF